MVKQPQQQTIMSPNATNIANNAVKNIFVRQKTDSSLPEDVPELPPEHLDNSDEDVIHGMTSLETQG